MKCMPLLSHKTINWYKHIVCHTTIKVLHHMKMNCLLYYTENEKENYNSIIIMAAWLH